MRSVSGERKGFSDARPLRRTLVEPDPESLELQRENAKYRAIFDASRDALILLNRTRIFDCNPAASELYGYTRSEFLAKSPGDLAPPSQAGGQNSFVAAREYIDAALSVGSQSFEWISQRADGSVFPSEVDLSRFEVQGEAVLQASVRDISERREKEQETAAVAEAETQRLRRNLNQHLCRAIIAASTETRAIADRLAATVNARDEVEALRWISAQLVQTGSDVRRLAEEVSPKPVSQGELTVALDELVTETESYFRIPCDFRCTTLFALNEEMLAGNLFQIAREALRNAAKFSRASRIEVALDWTDGVLSLSVADNGVGFDPEAAETAEIGMCIMRHRAMEVGATLEVQSSPGRGTTVLCSVPLAIRDDNPRFLSRLQNSEVPVQAIVDKLKGFGLTRRECEVLHWIVEGKRDSEIGAILSISSRTASHHVTAILRKLNVETRTAAAKKTAALLG